MSIYRRVIFFIVVWTVPVLIDFVTVIGSERFSLSEVVREIFYYQALYAISLSALFAFIFSGDILKNKFTFVCSASVLAWLFIGKAQAVFAHYSTANVYTMVASAVVAGYTVKALFKFAGRLELLAAFGPVAWLLLLWQATSLHSDYTTHRNPQASMATPPPPYKDIVFVVVDTLRADVSIKNPSSMWSQFYDTPSTTVFTEAWSPASGTAPSVKSMFTGSSPSAWGRDNVSVAPPDSVETIATYFQNIGYDTAGYTANALINGGGFSAGYEDYIALGGFDTIKHSLILQNLVFGKSTMSAFLWAEKKVLHKVDGGLILSLGKNWLSAQPQSAPNYLYLHIVDPHWPYRNIDGSASDKLSHVDLLQRKDGDPFPPDKDLAELKSRYLNEVEYSAHKVFEFISFLEETNRRDSTLVVVVGDHGEEFFEHGEFSHGHDSYQEQVNVPLIVFWPDSTQSLPAIVETAFSCSQIFDLMKAFSQGKAINLSDHVISESYPPNKNRAFYRKGNIAVRLEFHKEVSPLDVERVEVYNLTIDPSQQSPIEGLSEQHRQVVDDARENLHQRWLTWGDSQVTQEKGPRGVSGLKELGYVND
jgi:hypothetical protein